MASVISSSGEVREEVSRINIGEHELFWEQANIEKNFPSYYGQVGCVSDVQRCRKCNRAWPYGANEAQIASIPCIPDDPRAVNTIMEIERIKDKIDSLQRQIKQIQQCCPHKWTRDDIGTDLNGNPWGETCRVCGLWKEKNQTWEDVLRKK